MMRTHGGANEKETEIYLFAFSPAIGISSTLIIAYLVGLIRKKSYMLY